MNRSVAIRFFSFWAMIIFWPTNLMVNAQSFDSDFSFRFPIDSLHFSPFGAAPHFSLTPGIEKIFLHKEDEAQILKQRTLNLLEPVIISSPGLTRTVQTRVVEELIFDGENLIETRRYLLARALENGNIFCFGKEVFGPDVETGQTLQSGSWRFGVNGVGIGLFMPNLPLIGSRYYREPAQEVSMIKAEHSAVVNSLSTPFGLFYDTLRIDLNNDLLPTGDIQKDWYAENIGLIARNDFRLSQLRFGAEGLPPQGTFTAYSSHPYFPVSTGMRWEYEGREDFQNVRLTVEVLPETRLIEYRQNGELFLINVAVVESREWVGGPLHEVNRTFYAQCRETRDVFYLGEEVDIFLEGGAVVIHDGSWIVGVDDAKPGLIMPGDFIIGAYYLQDDVPDVSKNEALNEAIGLKVETSAGVFEDCIQILETSLIFPNELPSPKIYAPNVGLVEDDGALKLTKFVSPHFDPNLPHVNIQKAVLLQWPLTDEPFRLESSSNLDTWNKVNAPIFQDEFRFQMTVPSLRGDEFFRLVPVP